VFITALAITIIPLDMFRKIFIVPRVKAWRKTRKIATPAPEKKLEGPQAV